jgi:hypothetical protein
VNSLQDNQTNKKSKVQQYLKDLEEYRLDAIRILSEEGSADKGMIPKTELVTFLDGKQGHPKIGRRFRIILTNYKF